MKILGLKYFFNMGNLSILILSMLEFSPPLFLDSHWQEYVIVLLRNGRRKEEARNELNVFLGDDSTSFVSW